jgi:hypothetical protein
MMAARTEYWTRIRQVSLSRWAVGPSIGLVSSGTCLIAKRPVRYLTDPRNFSGSVPFDRVNETVRGWKGIVQVAASDAFFALDTSGNVHCAPLGEDSLRSCRTVESWRNVSRIVTGTQGSVLGVTKDGKVLCAGANAERAHMELSGLAGVMDIAPTGSECEQVIAAFEDGSVRDARTKELLFTVSPSRAAGGKMILDAHFGYIVFAQKSDTELYRLAGRPEYCEPVFRKKGRIVSFSVGDCSYSDPFVVAVVE